ncbi:Magnesium-chelatase 38 kDa subunit [Nocardia farcinica]|uniref:magnesium chelatase subunit D family protein n=1 Tax=Nocardia farcinica TaxID=37329 RepID=UPI000BFA44E2|nr:magnesium chelatase subunit D family protein [Nocardia farcinica]PFX00597.1 Magnesium-chelatase 38 kDa subunit [Nocardia farcinica]PFX08150.1 Magnesium-chelatase 38 kDa subunit [Nocardia farcinica]
MTEEAGFPFSAVVGQERLQLALILCAVHPGIGGVLVRGEKGTAKSTVVRALAQLLPPVVDETGARPARLVELPVGATEDRVVGSLDLERVLRDGEQAFRPGLLAAAHHGVLYVDEVNLLHDHLVDVLLDAAAMGRVHVERDGVSHSHPARFVLVGTMNPEEGELRPQLLDRFGLTVDVAASRDVDVRMTVVRRRLDYEADPAGFAARYAAADREIADRILAARDRVACVELDDTELRRIAALCAAFDVDGMRADLVVAPTATAHAAWRGADAVEAEDVRVAAELALPHRRRRDPFDEPGISEDQLDQAMRDAAEQAEPPATDEPDQPPRSADRGEDPGDGPDDPGTPPEGGPGGGQAPEGRTGTPAPGAAKPPRWEVPGVGEGAPGRRSRAQTRTGRVVRSTTEPGTGLHLLGTVFAAAPHQRTRGRLAGPLALAPEDLRGAYREGREGNLVVFVVDASGSMAARDRLSAVTGAIVTLLRDAYQRRDKVAVVSVRGATADLVLPPTSSVDIAVRRLAGLRTGGKTPLAAGLLRAREIVARERVRDPRRRPMLVLLTDGRATGGADPVGRAKTAAGLLARDGVTAMVVDCERGMVRLGLAADLARALGGTLVRLGELTGAAVADVVRAADPARSPRAA